MGFEVKEQSSIDPGNCDRPFFLKHFAAYRFAKDFVKGKKVLEIGCGKGYGSHYLTKYAEEVTAVDLFENNVEHAKSKGKSDNIRFYAMDACDLTFEENSFDVVLAFQLIEHIQRDLHTKFLRNIKRVLSGKGQCLLATPNLLNLRKRTDVFNFWRGKKKYEKNIHHDLEFEPGQFKDLLDAEFNKVDMYSVDYSMRQKIFIELRKSGMFKYLPNPLNIVKNYFENMPEEDYVVRKGNYKYAPDILAVVAA